MQRVENVIILWKTNLMVTNYDKYNIEIHVLPVDESHTYVCTTYIQRHYVHVAT